MIWRSVPSVLRCSATLEFCRVSTRSVWSVCSTTARTDHLDGPCLVHCAGKSLLFRAAGCQGCRRTSSWRSCFMSETFQQEKKQAAFSVMYASRQVLKTFLFINQLKLLQRRNTSECFIVDCLWRKIWSFFVDDISSWDEESFTLFYSHVTLIEV